MTTPSEETTAPATPVDPYAGARAMGIPAPPAPEVAPEPAVTFTDTGVGDQQVYIKNGDGTYSPVGGAETTPGQDASVPPSATETAVTVADDAENAVTAFAPGLAARLRGLISSHQDLLTAANEILAEVEKF